MSVSNGILNLTNGIQLRGGTAADLTSENPAINNREIMIDTSTGKIKVGRPKLSENGSELVTPTVYHWNELPYIGGWLAEELEDVETTIDKGTLHNSFRANNVILLDNALTAVANGTFKNIFPGTTIKKALDVVGGLEYEVLDVNYFQDMGLTNTPHIVVRRTLGGVAVEDETLASVANFSTNGYYGFTEFREWLSDYADMITSELGQEHVLEHNEYLCDGVTNGEPSSYNWYSSKCELMTGSQFFGDKFYGTAYLGGYPQFSYYRLSRGYSRGNSGILRDVASGNELWKITSGQPDVFTVAVGETYQLEPYFCIC